MKMHIARRISEAIGSWLHYEYCCHRGGLFTEDYLKAAVGGVLSSFPTQAKGVRAHANFPHAALNIKKRVGRKTEVDFALILNADGLEKSGAEILLETKWANSKYCDPESIFRDFLRLAIAKRGDEGAACIFLLAGTHSEVSKALCKPPFLVDGYTNNGIGSSGAEKRIKLDHSRLGHRKHFSKAITELSKKGLYIPESFMCRAHGLHPERTNNVTVKFQAIAWEVKDVSSRNIDPNRWASG